MRRILGFLFAALLVAQLRPNHVFAQTQFGTISGRVTDPTGGLIPSAKVTLTNLATGTASQTSTSSVGLFAFANVLAGNYEVAVEKQGFRKTVQDVTLDVAQNLDLRITLEVGKLTETVTVSEAGAAAVNTTNGDLSTTITPTDVEDLPLLGRNVYNLVALAPGAADTGTVTGDTRGLGLAINGARTADVNFMLDGGENNDTFVAGVGQTVPLDAVQEFKVQTNNMTAEYGRNAVNANVMTKVGTNALHGSVYEYYRGARLSTAPFDDNSTSTTKSNFVRNQFGASVGGPIKKDQTFFFGSFEGVRVRSAGTARFFVPTPDFLSNASSDTGGFINAFGTPPTGNCADAAVTAQQVVEVIESGGPGSYATSPLTNPNTGAPIPASTNLFCRTTVRAPIDTGAGLPQNTWLWTARIDHHFNDRTSLFGRYAFSNENNPPGTVSLSPYTGFNTGQRTRDQNLNLTLTHTWTPNFFSESRIIYNRVFSFQPEGKAPTTTPCWFYDLAFSTPTGDEITFPGYVPSVCAFAGIPFGGPQNIYQGYQGFTWSHGKHTYKAGGQFLQLRDNRTFGAFENAFEDSFTMQNMLNGIVDLAEVAIDPKGHVPGDTYDVSVDGPFGFPSFTRHFHYNEAAWYAEDQYKLTPRVTLTYGVRWEYFGVLHSPHNERLLDSNLFLNAVGPANEPLFEAIRDARFQRTTHFYQSELNNFSPRLGLAWDVFGNGRTVFRGGYGLFYDRNFGNAVFNVIQNPPNYAVITITPGDFGVAAPIKPNEFDTLGAVAGASLKLRSSARMLNRELSTAYSPQWNVTVEHNILGKGVIAAVSYVGANGIRLYSLNNLNQRGSCLLAPQIEPVCNPDGGRTGRLNQTGLSNMNRRGNEGLSRYNGLEIAVRTRQLANTGLTLRGGYTWSHSIDNESSFFADSALEGPFGFGFNNPFNPAADRASSSNDIRHRGTISAVWTIPAFKEQQGAIGHVLGGWTLSTIFVAQTGGAFSVYDGSTSSQCSFSGTNFCYPVIAGAVPGRTQTAIPGSPNSFALYNVSSTFTNQDTFCASDPDPLGCTARLNVLTPQLLSGRNLFRTPGFWDHDVGVIKDIRLSGERYKVQFRGEFFNLYNHSNLYVSSGSNVFTGTPVVGKRGCFPASPVCTGGKERRNIQLSLKFIF